MSELTRRDLLKLSGAAAAAGLGFPAVLEAQSKELVMLGLWSFTGAFADVGPVLDRGMKMALDERGMKIQGRAIKYITRDDETKAGSATRRAEEEIGRASCRERVQSAGGGRSLKGKHRHGQRWQPARLPG